MIAVVVFVAAALLFVVIAFIKGAWGVKATTIDIFFVMLTVKRFFLVCLLFLLSPLRQSIFLGAVCSFAPKLLLLLLSKSAWFAYPKQQIFKMSKLS